MIPERPAKISTGFATKRKRGSRKEKLGRMNVGFFGLNREIKRKKRKKNPEEQKEEGQTKKGEGDSHSKHSAMFT